MNERLFKNILANSFEDNLEDIEYLVENGFMEYAYIAHGGMLFYTHKQFLWMGKDTYENTVFSQVYKTN